MLYRYSGIYWSVRFSDLTSLIIYFQMADLYSMAFPICLALERNISEECQKITLDTIWNVLQVSCERMIKCLKREGGYVQALVEWLKIELCLFVCSNVMFLY